VEVEVPDDAAKIAHDEKSFAIADVVAAQLRAGAFDGHGVAIVAPGFVRVFGSVSVSVSESESESEPESESLPLVS
jgi:hypothetical protein